MRMMVLTGGPCAGKSTVLHEIQTHYGDQVVITPEAATILLASSLPAPKTWSLEWQDDFQAAVAKLQQEIEIQTADLKADLAIYDRGLLDGAAYTPGGIKRFCRRYGVQIEKLAYNQIIHLESLATARPELYGNSNNPHRFEGLAQAQDLEHKTRKAWSWHQHHIFLPGHQGLTTSLQTICHQVERHLT